MADRRFHHPEREPEALRLWAEGETVSDITAALGVSPGWVYRRLKWADVFYTDQTRLPGHEAVAARTAELQARGYRLVEVVKITGWSRSSIYRARRWCNAPRAWLPTTAEERAEIVRQWLAARRVKPVARRCGRHWKTVRDVVRAAGVYEPATQWPRAAEEHPWRREIRNRLGPKGRGEI